MQVVWIAPDASFPARRGGSLRLQGLLRALAPQVRVRVLAAAADASEAKKAEAHLHQLGVEARVVVRGSTAAWWSQLGAARIERWFATPALQQLVAAECGPMSTGKHILHVDEPSVLRCVPASTRVHTIAHPKLDLEYAQAFAVRAAERRDVARVRNLEARCVRPRGTHPAPVQLLTCREDLQRLQTRHPEAQCAVVPNGVDAVALGPVPSFLERDTTRLLWLGSLDYPPNVQGLIAFLRTSWPALRQARPGLVLEVVGSGPSQHLGDLRIEGVRLLGEVEDVRPALARAGALLVPLLVGGGTRLKLLEAAAYGVPIVATRVAAEGLELHEGVHLRLVERIEHLADAALEVLDQRASARERCEAARAVVLEHYDWKVAAAAVLDVWRRAAAHTVA